MLAEGASDWEGTPEVRVGQTGVWWSGFCVFALAGECFVARGACEAGIAWVARLAGAWCGTVDYFECFVEFGVIYVVPAQVIECAPVSD